ncbi:MAG: hypothetical protein MUF37_02460 [Methanoregulaceae archaeon]|jgi:hypothetical protein|nr:hypothetical protein [Methanoregulaceae archaeon]
MVSQSFNAGKKSIRRSTYEPDRVYEQVMDVGEPHTSLIKTGAVITNLCISLVVMALFAACSHPFP